LELFDMPCGDITERIKIKLGDESRLISYNYYKKTCGGSVGPEEMIIDGLKGKPAEEIIYLSEIDLFKSYIFEDEIIEFLNLKHFFAVKSALKVFLGVTSGGIGETCTIAGVEYSNDETIVDADINIELITDQIKACAHCAPG
jgi:hypothetical protein